MAVKLIECVVNFSEGRDIEVINKIASEIIRTPGVKLLDIDVSLDANRSVMSFIGKPEKVTDAAFKAIRKSLDLIDMRKHKGLHPRIGAADVCPFIPLKNISIGETIDIAHKFAKRVGEQLMIPVYCYGEAALKANRVDISNIRHGQYEELELKLQNPEWKPDFGPARFVPSAGATAIGARDFLVAYNVNLDTTDDTIAKQIAAEVRESGHLVQDVYGNLVRQPGTLKCVKAIGWFIKDFNKSQVSMNLQNTDITPLHKAFEEVKRLAKEKGVTVTGSEIVGLIHLDDMLATGNFYKQLYSLNNVNSEVALINTAISYLGLNDVRYFTSEKKIIEYAIDD